VWEAKDIDDDLEKEIKKKFAAGYPRENILFQTPHWAVLYQGGQRLYDADLTRSDDLVHVLELFFNFQPQVIDQWEKAAEEFKERVPDLGKNIAKLIRNERKTNNEFKSAFIKFLALCRTSLNPNLSEDAVEEMIVQHLLTERIFRKVFISEEFMRRNVIAVEIEKVIKALIAKKFKRDDFVKSLEHFYVAIEHAAETITDFSEKQKFLNTVYERFFQGFCVKIADTHGIVYTPVSLVEFMVNSIEQGLHEHFDTALEERNVHILDPFTGTGNFIVHIMERMQSSSLVDKYREELFCNEVMLLPYYVASMTEENTARVKRQRKAPIKVIIANPPYNAGQVNENDNNKNRKYSEIDERIRRTYSKDSEATLVRKLNDPYVRAIRFASDRIGETGVICYVNNNSFITEKSFDGMRKHLAQDFDMIYVLDLGGNVRKDPSLSGTTHNVFGIQVGVSINLFIRLPRKTKQRYAKIHYYAVPGNWRKEQKYEFLETTRDFSKVDWKVLTPDKKYNWITGENEKEFENFIPLGSKESKARGVDPITNTIFYTYSLGVSTNRDSVVYDFSADNLAFRCEQFADQYNSELDRWRKKAHPPKEPKALIQYIDNFVSYERIKWSRNLKRWFKQNHDMVYDPSAIRDSAYRPFTRLKLQFDRMFVDELGSCSVFFPTPKQEQENFVLLVPSAGGRSPFWCFATNLIPNLNFVSIDSAQCFGVYIYNEDGKERQDNISNAALKRFETYYNVHEIAPHDMAYYVYAVMHHPDYRARYAENLKRELPRIPIIGSIEEFREFVAAGRRLVNLHVHYERQKQWDLRRVESKDTPLNWRVEAMKLSKDGESLFYNEHFTFTGIPPEVYQYRLGNRSALEWIIDQYRVTRDLEGNILCDPNSDDEQYIARLVGQVITVSVETMKIVKNLPEMTEQ